MGDEYAIEKSIQRARRNATKRAYLKHFQSDRSPLGGKPPNKEVIAEYNERAHSVGPEPVRVSIKTVAIVNKKTVVGVGYTPTITEPKKAVVNALHKMWENRRNAHWFEAARNSFFVFRICFDGYDARACYWIECLDIGRKELRVSFTLSSKKEALENIKRFGEHLPWKTKAPYVGELW